MTKVIFLSYCGLTSKIGGLLLSTFATRKVLKQHLAAASLVDGLVNSLLTIEIRIVYPGKILVFFKYLSDSCKLYAASATSQQDYFLPYRSIYFQLLTKYTKKSKN
jgi:hypothetical protein